MKTTVEIRLFELLQGAFSKEKAQEIVGEIKSMTHDDLLDRVDDKVKTAKGEIISSLTWRLLFFFFAQVGFIMGLLKFIGAV